MAEILRCPACAGADTSVASAEGVHTCVFCGVRYRVSGGATVAAPAAPASKPPRAVAVGAAMVGMIALVGVAAVTLTRRDPPPAAPVAAASAEVATAASAGSAASAATSTSTPPPPEPEPSVTFTQHHTTPGVDGAFWVYGLAENTSPWPIDNPRFDLVFLDAAGGEVGVDQGYATGDAMAPGEVRPVKLLASKPPKHASFRVEGRPRKATWTPTKADGLVLTEFPVTDGTLGGWQLSGKVRNGGAAPARFVRVSVAAWDAQERLVGVEDTYAAGEEGLAAGAEARYTVTLRASERPARFTTTVDGRR